MKFNELLKIEVKLMNKTLFITDLDGTLLNSEAKVTPFTANTINNLIDAGMIFTYATARSFHTALLVTSNINFKYPAVHHNGVFIQDPKNGEYAEKCILDKDKIARVIQTMRDNKLYPLLYALIDGRERVSWISGQETDGIKFYLKTRKNDKRLRQVQDYSEFTGDIYNIIFVSDHLEELEQILSGLNLDSHFTHHIHVDAYKHEDGKTKYWLEIMRYDAQKDTGVQKVKTLVGADKIICFGDNINDLPMFKISDESYAVKNALPEVKKIATTVIGSNDEDGVAKWLEKNIL
jgi:Cof subfamily protein (haloacid dehalogenase superfamily)